MTMQHRVCLPALALLVVGVLPVGAQMARDAAIAKAEGLLKNLQEGKTADIVKAFDDRMAKDLPEDRLKSVWPALDAQFGAFKSVVERREGQMQGRQAVELILAFEKQTIVDRTVFDDAGRVTGLVFRPLDAAVLPPNK